LGGGKKVKGGGALTTDGNVLWALKGNNTSEFYKYVPAAFADRLPLTANRSGIQNSAECGVRNAELRIAPNPFSAAATITYSLPEAGNVSLKLYDVSGKLVTTLASGCRSAGPGTCVLLPAAGVLARGVYVVRLSMPGTVVTAKLIVE
jgi:hypothetical protein